MYYSGLVVTDLRRSLLKSCGIAYQIEDDYFIFEDRKSYFKAHEIIIKNENFIKEG